jgi:hypothetical protein
VSLEVLDQSLRGLTDSEVDKVTHLNAMRQFHYDPFTVLGGRANCTVGTLRKQVEGHDVTIRAQRREGDDGSHSTNAADLMKTALSHSE